MKRLIKANKQEVDLIIDWICNGHLDISNEQINNITSKNKDCVYNGFGYRYLQFDFDDIFSLFGGYDEMSNSTETIAKSEILSKVETLIDKGDKYCSFAKTLEDAIDFSLGVSNGYSASIIIGGNVSGLDTVKFLSKMVNNGEVKESAELECHMDHDEIISKTPSNIEIISFLNLDINKWPNELVLSELAESIYDNYIK